MSQTTRTTTEKITFTWHPRHHVAATKKQHSALATDMWESWKAVPHEVKEAVLHELSVKGLKFPEIDRFKEVYIRPGDELTKQLHSTMVEKGHTVLEEVASKLPLETSIEEVFTLEDAGFQIMTDTRSDPWLSTWECSPGAWASRPSGPVCLILQVENIRGQNVDI
ncbi:hypothetical protein C1H46_012145 [Malus baccata]|uniref:Uncharacterized protein n=1 Tax=Malus baccata TaxID=106549 RepID=A0A540MU03_MALBA|nr:hypothetical protein C1H46_012145 [Malus baccata]